MQPLGLSQGLIFFGKISKNLLTRKEKGIKKESPTYRKGEIEMTRFYDSNRVLDITMRAESGEDFSRDFFEDACTRKNYNEDLDAYRVEDIDYLVDYAKDYKNGTNRDFPADTDAPVLDLDYSIEDRPSTDPVDLETEAASLYDGGWRAKDRDAIQKEYDLTDDDTEAIVEKLAEYENR